MNQTRTENPAESTTQTGVPSRASRRFSGIQRGILASVWFAAAAVSSPAWAMTDLAAGARGFAMGAAYTAISDDLTAPAWNPACLPLVAAGGVGLTHGVIPALSGLALDFLSGVYPGGTYGVGAAWMQTTGTLVQGADETRSRMTDSSGIVAFGSRVTAVQGLHAGAALRWSGVSSIAGESSGFALDAGLHYNLPMMPMLSVGATVRSLAGSAPLGARIAVSAAPFVDESLHAAVELQAKPDIKDAAGLSMILHAGAEYVLLQVVSAIPEIAIRAGFDTDGVTFGVGLARGILRLDYAGTAGRSYGMQHRAGLSVEIASGRASPGSTEPAQ